MFRQSIKNIFYSFLIIILFSNYIFGQVEAIKIKGKILHPISEKVRISSVNGKTIKTAKLNNGNFALNFETIEGYYTFHHGSESTAIYLQKKDDLIIDLDAELFDESIIYKGKGSQRNNYLAKKALIKESAKKDISKFHEGTEEDYLIKNQDLYGLIKDTLKTFAVEDFFIKEEHKSISYDYLLQIKNYKSLQEYYFGKKVKVSHNFLSPLKIVNYDNEYEFNSQPYYGYLVLSKWKKDIEKEKGFTEMNKKYHEVNSPSIKIALLKSFYYSISKNKEKAEDYFNLIKSNTPSSNFISMARKKMKTVLKIKKGVKSPSFSFKNAENKTYSLSDFKGKYVFIDVWATWCRPCLQQIPALKVLEEEFKKEEIVFVSISVDKNNAYDKWKTMIKEKELGGIQLFSDNSFSSKFVKAYGISSIPRFILIDKEGNIYDENMSKPSSKSTKEVLEKLLKN